MADKSAIEWTDSTWNPVSGCSKVSTGCKFCYAERVSKRMGQEFTKITLHPERLERPLRWRKPRRIFVNSMSDLFHEDVPDDFILSVLAVVAATRDHTYQVLTKRAERMASVMSAHFGANMLEGAAEKLAAEKDWCYAWDGTWPLPNLWLGVSCENQEQADKRIRPLLQTPAVVRFVSLEPLLGPVDLFRVGMGRKEGRFIHGPGIDWIIVGGESGGPPERALVKQCSLRFIPLGDGPRPCARCGGSGWAPKPEALDWIRAIRDQCQAAGVGFFFKQWGGPRPKSGGRLLDGREWNEFPGPRE